ncbi:MAG: 3,4-dihydroxy-2-butanone-4-phosphate synthase, partial [Paracoccaceae bacterium]
MARLPYLVAFAQLHNLKIGTISDLIRYRRRHDHLVNETAKSAVTSAFGGDWMMRIYTDETHGSEHIVMTKGDITTDAPVLTRMHAMNPLQDVLGIGRTSSDLENAMRVIAKEGRGIVVLLRDTNMKLVRDGEASPQTLRLYGLGAQILAALNLSELILLTNSGTPRVVGLDAYGLSIVGTQKIPSEV